MAGICPEKLDGSTFVSGKTSVQNLILFMLSGWQESNPNSASSRFLWTYACQTVFQLQFSHECIPDDFTGMAFISLASG